MTNKNRFYGGYVINTGSNWIDVVDSEDRLTAVTYNDLDFGKSFGDFCEKYGIAKNYKEYVTGEIDE